MKKILLINTPSNDDLSTYKPFAPLGILSLAAYLRENSVDVLANDLNVATRWEKELTELVRTFKPSIVGFTSNISNAITTKKGASLVKNNNANITVIVGGPQPTIAPQEYQEESIDYIIPHEGEKVLLDFIHAADKDTVEGVLSVKNGRLDGHHENLELQRSEMVNLESLPTPAYDMINMREYSASIYKFQPNASMITSRGCPNHCTYCSQSVFGHKWRALSAEKVVEQMLYLKREFGIKEIIFVDDNFTHDLDRVFKICQLINESGEEIYWQLNNGIRADRLSKPLLKEMKKAGCWCLRIAPEVGDEDELVKIRKNIKLDRFREVAAWCREFKIVYYCYFMIGLPFQTAETMDKAINFAMELDPLFAVFNRYIPFQQTELFTQAMDATKYANPRRYNCFFTKNTLVNRKYFKAFFKFYVRPNKLAEIIRTIGFNHFLRLFLYSQKTFFTLKR